MILDISIRDFAIVERLELDLDDGLSALTGETGAGKSILVDALGLLLGDRADATMIRHGADRAELGVRFRVPPGGDAAAWLAEHAFVEDGAGGEPECVMRRVLLRGKPSRAYINDRSATTGAMRALGQMLVDIHGQNTHQSLVRADVQRSVLDGYAGITGAVDGLAERYADFRALVDRREAIERAGHEATERLELLRFQLGELAEAELAEGEYEALTEELETSGHADELLEAIGASVDALYEAEDGTVSQTLARMATRLEGLVGYLPALAPVAELVGDARVRADEAAAELRRLRDRIDLDPARFEWVQSRLGELHGLARKHRCEPAELPATEARLHAEVQELEQRELDAGALDARIAQARDAYDAAAAEVSRDRAAAAERLGAAVTERMQSLGMAGGRLAVALHEIEPREPTRYGHERAELEVSANPGQPLRPLSRVASGGELSRISLAIQVEAAEGARVPTLVFDEVDVGIGGGVAEIVGTLLRRLGAAHQVLCVTHLAQVAAQAHQQIKVSKAGETNVSVAVHNLSRDERIEEIARMLGGIEITPRTRAHADEMLAQVAP